MDVNLLGSYAFQRNDFSSVELYLQEESSMRRLLVLGVVIAFLAVGSPHSASAQTSLDPANFALTPWDFPGPANVVQSRVETNDLVANEQAVPHFGSQSFSQEGRVSGYFMEANIPNLEKDGTVHAVVTYYLVSSFATTDQAAAAFMQQRDGWGADITLPPTGMTAQLVALPDMQQLGDQMASGLYVAESTTSEGNVDESELLFQRGIYLVEVFQAYRDSDASYAAAEQPVMLALATKLDGVASGQIAGPPAPTPPTTGKVSILSVRFEQNGLPLDIEQNLQAKPMTHISTGSTVQASVYFAVLSAPPKARFTCSFTLSRGSHKLHRKLSNGHGAYPLGYYRADLYDITFLVPGTYKLVTTVKVAGDTEKGITKIRVSGTRTVRASTAVRTLLARSVRARLSTRRHILPDMVTAPKGRSILTPNS